MEEGMLNKKKALKFYSPLVNKKKLFRTARDRIIIIILAVTKRHIRPYNTKRSVCVKD